MDPRVIDLKEGKLFDEQCAAELERLFALRAASPLPLPPVTCVWLTGNRLTRVPELVLHLTQLESLYLGRNHLTSVPRELGLRLTSLTSLGLSNNPLRHLPTELTRLTRLQSLYLDASGAFDRDAEDECELPADLLPHLDRDPRGVALWMEELRRYNAPRDRCLSAVLTLLACRRFRAAENSFLRLVPRELVAQMARHLWASRRSRAVWTPDDVSTDAYRPTEKTLRQLAHRLATRVGDGGANEQQYMHELTAFFERL